MIYDIYIVTVELTDNVGVDLNNMLMSKNWITRINFLVILNVYNLPAMSVVK